MYKSAYIVLFLKLKDLVHISWLKFHFIFYIFDKIIPFRVSRKLKDITEHEWKDHSSLLSITLEISILFFIYIEIIIYLAWRWRHIYSKPFKYYTKSLNISQTNRTYFFLFHKKIVGIENTINKVISCFYFGWRSKNVWNNIFNILSKLFLSELLIIPHYLQHR